MLQQAVNESWCQIALAKTRTLVAVSGGPDSVALLRALAAIKGLPAYLEVAHFDHGWRQDSQSDCHFVQQLASSLSLPVHIGRANPTSTKGHSEESARVERYAFLEATAGAIGARYVVTGHTANDRVETMLHNLFRGTGLAGICALSASRPLGDELVLLRPMLQCWRADVVQFLEELRQPYRVDSTNRDANYKRNFLRHKVLPLLAENYGNQLTPNLAGFIDHVDDVEDLLQNLAESYEQNVQAMLNTSNSTPGTAALIQFPANHFLDVPWPVLHLWLVRRWKGLQWPLGSMTRKHWMLIRHLHEQNDDHGNWQPKSATLPGNLRLTSRPDWIQIRPASQEI